MSDFTECAPGTTILEWLLNQSQQIKVNRGSTRRLLSEALTRDKAAAWSGHKVYKFLTLPWSSHFA